MTVVFEAAAAALAAGGATAGTAGAATTLGSAATAAVQSAFGIGSASATAGSIASTALTGLSTAFSIGSALSALGQGKAQESDLKIQGMFADVEAEQEKARGAAEQRDFAREYAALTGEQQVIQAANGLNTSVGSPEKLAESTTQFADRNLDVSRSNVRNRVGLARLRKRSLLANANNAIFASRLRTGQMGLDAYQLLGD